MKKYSQKLILAFSLLIGANGAYAQAPGSSEATGGTIGSSALSSASGDTTSSVSETLYIGPGNYQVDGVWAIYSKNIWISPDATITGAGTILFYNPSDAGGVASATLVDGNNNAAFINVNMELHNAANMVLTDIAGPGAPWNDAVGNANLTVGQMFSFSVTNGDVLLGNNDMVIATAATLNNYMPTQFVVTNGTGHLVHNNYTGVFTYPVGITEGNYTPASVSNVAANTLHVMVQNYATSASIEGGFNGIDRTWNIYADNAAGNSVITLQHNLATNAAMYNDANSFVTRYSATIPNTTGQTALSQTAWQSNNMGAGSGSGTLTAGSTISGASERSLVYTNFATAASTPEAFFTKSNNQITPLPLTLTSFTGQAVNCSAILNWTTGMESGMDHFELQKSNDGSSFEAIANIAAKGTNSNYTYTDNNSASGKAFYRLHMIETDGKGSFSKVVLLTMDCNAASMIDVYPNPVDNKVTITGIHAGDQLFLTDALGQILNRATANNSVQEINTSGLASGTYLLQVVNGNTLIKVVKLMKQ